MAHRAIPLALALLLLAAPVSAALAQPSTMMETNVVVLSPSDNSNVSGLAWVTQDGDHLIVTTLIWGLAPGSAHSNHIHSGSCANQGGIVYDLADLTANEQGMATATTRVNTDMSMMGMASHYVNVHAGILGSAPTAAPGITCGNIGEMIPMMPMMPMMPPMMPMDPMMPGM
jgi:hypothetical protein